MPLTGTSLDHEIVDNFQPRRLQRLVERDVRVLVEIRDGFIVRFDIPGGLTVTTHGSSFVNGPESWVLSHFNHARHVPRENYSGEL